MGGDADHTARIAGEVARLRRVGAGGEVPRAIDGHGSERHDVRLALATDGRQPRSVRPGPPVPGAWVTWVRRVSSTRCQSMAGTPYPSRFFTFEGRWSAMRSSFRRRDVDGYDSSGSSLESLGGRRVRVRALSA